MNQDTEFLIPELQTLQVADSPEGSLELKCVSGFSKEKTYIICKDPTNEKDAAAFWEMVWQENCYVIVILERLMETERKTYTYWPDKEDIKKFDSITVKTEDVQYFNNYIERTFQVKRLMDTRQVTQIQFPHLYSDRLPSDTVKLFIFRQKVKELSKDMRRPLVVQCSDGKSRSGLYSALDMVLADLERQDQIKTPADHYLEQLRAKDLISSDKQIDFLTSTIESWKSSTEVQNSSHGYLKF